MDSPTQTTTTRQLGKVVVTGSIQMSKPGSILMSAEVSDKGLSWQNRIARIRERCRDLWGREGWRWRVIRTSNAYVFRDPQAAVSAGIPSKSENRAGTLDQEVLEPIPAPPRDPNSPLERALARFGAAVAAKNGIEQGGRK